MTGRDLCWKDLALKAPLKMGLLERLDYCHLGFVRTEIKLHQGFELQKAPSPQWLVDPAYRCLKARRHLTLQPCCLVSGVDMDMEDSDVTT